jgi:release factor glutamine methyltransferase
MNIREAERYIKDGLSNIYDEQEAVNIARMVIEHITSLDRTSRLLKKDLELTLQQSGSLDHILARLKQHEPVQYVIGKCWFSGMELYVNSSVLIPRPETEELVDWIIKDVKAAGIDVFERRRSEADQTKSLKILDVGTGSGCIALALKKAMPKAEVWGCDVSDEALVVARRNGSALDIRVDFQGVDFLDLGQQKSLPTVDILVSNPPYVPLSNIGSMRANVVEHEPHTALFVPNNDPLVFYRALALFGRRRLYEHGNIYMEIHEDLSNDVSTLFEAEGYTSIQIRKDMQGKERMVKVVKA